MFSLLGAGLVWSIIVIRLWDGQSGVHIQIWLRHFTLLQKHAHWLWNPLCILFSGYQVYALGAC